MKLGEGKMGFGGTILKLFQNEKLKIKKKITTLVKYLFKYFAENWHFTKRDIQIANIT